MKRMEEYEAMMARLEVVPQSSPVEKAKKRYAGLRRLRRSFAGITAAFCVFVAMINVSPTVSAACRELPFLKELVTLLTFNPSLRIAIEHDYVQMVGQEQTKDGVTGRVEYLIVDQKQVNVFFTLDSDNTGLLDALPEVTGENGEHFQVVMSYGGLPDENEELRQITVDFVDENVPDQMYLTLKIRDIGSREVVEEAPVNSVGENWPESETPEILTELTFDLRLDPQYTGQGRTVRLDKNVSLDGQKITITDMEIYPTHIRINVEEDESNTAWLNSLRFHLELEDGFRVETISNGISATGSQDSPSMVSYRAESSYFYEADCIRLIITGADFLDKEREELYVNLRTLESDPLPQGVTLKSAVEKTNGTELTFLLEPSEINHVQILGSTYYDLQGNEYFCGSMSSGQSFYDEQTQEVTPAWDFETYYLEDFHEAEAIFKVHYTHFWTPEEPLTVELTNE